MIDLYYWTTPNGHKITIYLDGGIETDPVWAGSGCRLMPR